MTFENRVSIARASAGVVTILTSYIFTKICKLSKFFSDFFKLANSFDSIEKLVDSIYCLKGSVYGSYHLAGVRIYNLLIRNLINCLFIILLSYWLRLTFWWRSAKEKCNFCKGNNFV